MNNHLKNDDLSHRVINDIASEIDWPAVDIHYHGTRHEDDRVRIDYIVQVPEKNQQIASQLVRAHGFKRDPWLPGVDKDLGEMYRLDADGFDLGLIIQYFDNQTS